jgi:hypothetical protein
LRKSLTAQDAALLLVFALTLALTVLLTFEDTPWDPKLAFAGEYGNMAENLLLGNGFSGPFGVSDQKSAWMPPLLVVMMAAVFGLFGIKSMASAKALLALQAFSLWLSLALLLLIAKRSPSPRWPLAVLLGLFVVGNRHSLFASFHDTGITVLLSCFALYCLLALHSGQAIGPPMLCAALLPLASPALALAYSLLTLVSAGGRRKVLMVLACCLLSVLGWSARNVVALGSFVPMKSNLWFDFHQANVVDRDGVVADATFLRAHPMGPNSEVVFHYSQGEMPFMEHHRRSALEAVREQPGAFLGRILARAVNAFVLLKSGQELAAIAFTLDANTQAHLSKNHLALGTPRGTVWSCLDLDPGELRSQLQGLEKQEALFEDWQRARAAVAARSRQPSMVSWGLAHALLPSLALLLGGLRGSVRGQPGFRFAAGLYLLYLAPYVIVSHYIRYQLALMGLAAYLIWQSTLRAGPSEPDGAEPDQVESH